MNLDDTLVDSGAPAEDRVKTGRVVGDILQELGLVLRNDIASITKSADLQVAEGHARHAMDRILSVIHSIVWETAPSPGSSVPGDYLLAADPQEAFISVAHLGDWSVQLTRHAEPEPVEMVWTDSGAIPFCRIRRGAAWGLGCEWADSGLNVASWRIPPVEVEKEPIAQDALEPDSGPTSKTMDGLWRAIAYSPEEEPFWRAAFESAATESAPAIPAPCAIAEDGSSGAETHPLAEESLDEAVLRGRADDGVGHSTQRLSDSQNPCPSCGLANRASAKFCRECGAAMAGRAPATEARFCAQCGKALKPGVRFCGACGAPVAGGKGKE